MLRIAPDGRAVSAAAADHEPPMTSVPSSSSTPDLRPGRATLTAAAALAVLALAGWAALFAEALRAGAVTDPFLQALCRPLALERGLPVLRDLVVAAALWCAMSLAMMLPTAVPMVMNYADVAERRAAEGLPTASPVVLIAGYAGVWIAVSILAALVQAAGAALLARWALPAPALAVLAGTAIGAAGLWQFSETKQACLAACRHPLPALEGGAAGRVWPVLRLGVAQGVACLGCCGAMMAMMVAVGAMNLLWMALFALAMTIEKMTTGRGVPAVLGVALIVAGLAVAAGGVGIEAILRFARG
jgi:predicted metal-binding membrane protein